MNFYKFRHIEIRIIKLLLPFVWFDRKSHTRTKEPHAENNKLVLRSCSTATTGPACDLFEIIIYMKIIVCTIIANLCSPD